MNTYTIALTDAQRAIISHRLEVGDAIADCFTDEQHPEWDSSEIMEVAEQMLRELEETGELHVETSLQREIAIDCMNGSTYYAASEGWGDASVLELGQIERSLKAIQRKYSASGLRCDVVTY